MKILYTDVNSQANYIGSSGRTESEGAKEMFEASRSLCRRYNVPKKIPIKILDCEIPVTP